MMMMIARRPLRPLLSSSNEMMVLRWRSPGGLCSGRSVLQNAGDGWSQPSSTLSHSASLSSPTSSSFSSLPSAASSSSSSSSPASSSSSLLASSFASSSSSSSLPSLSSPPSPSTVAGSRGFPSYASSTDSSTSSEPLSDHGPHHLYYIHHDLHYHNQPSRSTPSRPFPLCPTSKSLSTSTRVVAPSASSVFPMSSSSSTTRLFPSFRSFSSSPSFIRAVLNQVREDLNKNPELKKAMSDLQSSSARFSSPLASQKLNESISSAIGRSNALKSKLASLAYDGGEKAGENISLLKEKIKKLNERVTQSVDRSPTLSRASQIGSSAASHVSSVAHKLIEAISGENDQKAAVLKKAALWRERMTMKRKRAERKMAEDGVDDSVRHDGGGVADGTRVSAAAGNAQSGLGRASERHHLSDKVQERGDEGDAHKTTHTRGNDGVFDDDDDDGTVQETALVVSRETAWERFGSRLRDMPFLQNFYENAVFGKLFGETEVAASLREMKALDPSFKLPELMELVEYVIAPHLIDCFLQGDDESLSLHCGEAAYAALRASIRERTLMKVFLDPTVLTLRNVDLRGARRMDDGAPWFIFSFNTQQINCLRTYEAEGKKRNKKDGDKKGTDGGDGDDTKGDGDGKSDNNDGDIGNKEGRVVSGAIDDIREVMYSIALSKHPKPDTVGLQYPWMVKEFAIIANSPSW